MKTVKITFVITSTDDFYEKELVEIKQDILSGTIQRSFRDAHKKGGLINAKATFEEIKAQQQGKYNAALQHREQFTCRYCKTPLKNPVSIEGGYCDMWCFERGLSQ